MDYLNVNDSRYIQPFGESYPVQTIFEHLQLLIVIDYPGLP